MANSRLSDLCRQAHDAYPHAEGVDRAAKVVEEAAELLKAIMTEGRPVQYGKRRSFVPAPCAEMADLLVASFALCHALGMDPEEAVIRQLARNRARG